MKNIANTQRFTLARGLIYTLLVVLTGCALPRPASTPVVYDFGPGPLQTQPNTHPASLPPLELSNIKASDALSSTAVRYRLGYANAQQLQPYTLARWSMPPAQLIGQRLRAQLALQRPVLAPGDITLARPTRGNASAPGAAPVATAQPQAILGLHLELEEFSQLFDSTDKSRGVLRLRVTVIQRSAAGETLLAQRHFIAQPAAPTPDASGGVRALTAAVDQVVKEVEEWVEQVERGKL